MLLALATIQILDRYSIHDTAIIYQKQNNNNIHTKSIIGKSPPTAQEKKKAGRPCALFFAY